MSQSTSKAPSPQRPQPRCRVCGCRLVKWGKSMVCIGCPIPIRLVVASPNRPEAA
jgi:hypothetical protein